MATPTYLKPEFSDLEDCVDIASNLYSNTAGSASHEEFSKIVGNTSTSSYFGLKLNSMRAYGFVDLAGDRIQITSLGQTIVAPTHADERLNALVAALMNFPIFKNIAQRYLDKPEPEHKYVENALLNEGKIKRDKATAWADCFLKSARFAEIFHLQKVSRQVSVNYEAVKRPPESSPIAEGMQEQELRPGWLTYPVPVPGGMARIIVPSNLSRQAWEKLKKLLEAIEPANEGELKQ